MKKSIMCALVAALASFASFAQAQETPTEATVAQVTGTATFKVGGGAAQPIAVGTKIPQGAEITTADKSQVTIKAHDGIVALAGAKTIVTVDALSVNAATGMRTATIGLKSGNLASSLDPKMKNQNNYSVRTPKGVAAARGTTYSVSYDGVTYSVTVVAGVVQSFSATGASVNVNVGQVSSNTDAGTTTQTLAQAIAAPGSTVGDGVSLLAAAIASVSDNVADVAAVINTIASNAGTGQAATNVVASATAAAAGTAAVMLASSSGGSTAAAQAIVNAAVSGSAAAGNSAAASTIVATSTVAVVSTTGQSVSSVATALTETANTTAGVSVNATNVTNAATTAIVNTGGVSGNTAIVEIKDASGNVDVVEAPVVNPVTPVNPDISVSPAGG